MPRVAIIADSHYDESKRFAECVRVHDWIAEDIRQRGVDLAVHTGDVFERKSTPTERTAAASWAQRIADVCPFVIVRGNHDYDGDLEILGRLERRFPIVVVESASCGVYGGVAVAGVAWPRKAQLLARLGSASQQEGEGAAQQALRNVLLGLGEELAAHPGPKLLAMHAMVRGSVTSTGQPLVGCDMELGLEDLALAGADFYALGHIHKSQTWEVGGAPVVYPGSPRRTAFGEYERKGYVIVNFPEDGGNITWEFIETPCTRMEHHEATFANGTFDVWFPGSVVGAEVRFRYHVQADEREAAKAQVAAFRERLLAGGAVSVQVEEIVKAKTRARAPELAAAKTLEEKLAALWAARGEELDEERRARLFAKLAVLEEEMRRAA